ncbi:unnamed protein product [Diplocarpon coronariae]|nr:hypothetical protein JHW43_004344 [Diplocarpon mali]
MRPQFPEDGEHHESIEEIGGPQHCRLRAQQRPRPRILAKLRRTRGETRTGRQSATRFQGPGISSRVQSRVMVGLATARAERPRWDAPIGMDSPSARSVSAHEYVIVQGPAGELGRVPDSSVRGPQRASQSRPRADRPHVAGVYSSFASPCEQRGAGGPTEQDDPSGHDGEGTPARAPVWAAAHLKSGDGWAPGKTKMSSEPPWAVVSSSRQRTGGAFGRRRQQQNHPRSGRPGTPV